MDHPKPFCGEICDGIGGQTIAHLRCMTVYRWASPAMGLPSKTQGTRRKLWFSDVWKPQLASQLGFFFVQNFSFSHPPSATWQVSPRYIHTPPVPLNPQVHSLPSQPMPLPASILHAYPVSSHDGLWGSLYDRLAASPITNPPEIRSGDLKRNRLSVMESRGASRLGTNRISRK